MRNFKEILLVIILLNQTILSFILFAPKEFPDSYEIKPFKFLQQPDEITCGPTSATMILNSYGIKANIQNVASLTKTHWFDYHGVPIGLSLPEYLKKALHYYGIPANIKRGDIYKLKYYISENKPVILLGRSGPKNWHYFVGIGYDKENLIIANPATGNREVMTLKVFEKCWEFNGDMDGIEYNDFMGWLLRKTDITDIIDHIMIVPKLATNY